jgi:tripartite-type tricarboxylate transporter receptor subunit TctC
VSAPQHCAGIRARRRARHRRTPARAARGRAAWLVNDRRQPGWRERYASISVDPVVSSSTAAFATFVREEFARWEKVVRSTGVQLQQ